MLFLIQQQCDSHLHCILYLCIRSSLQCMPEKTLTTADFSLLRSLLPPTSEIVIDKIPDPMEKCQLNPTFPPEKNDCCTLRVLEFLLEKPLALLSPHDAFKHHFTSLYTTYFSYN